MTDFLSLTFHNFSSPAILFFVLGVSAGFLKSDLELPESISRYLSLYLMMAIGFKGGAALAANTHLDVTAISTMVTGILFSFGWPFVAYNILRQATKMDRFNAAATATHYGSVSVVTFATAINFIGEHSIAYEGYLVAVMALMEAPAILAGLYLAQRARGKAHKEVTLNKDVIIHSFTNGAVFLLMGSFAIAYISGADGYKKMEPLLITPFQGVLALFLLDLGLLVARQLHHLKNFTLPVFLYGIYMPFLGGAAGLLLSSLLGLDLGTGFVFTILAASASYIAVPAAMKIAVPEANVSIYVPLALAITFPVNIILGIPIYYELAKFFLKASGTAP